MRGPQKTGQEPACPVSSALRLLCYQGRLRAQIPPDREDQFRACCTIEARYCSNIASVISALSPVEKRVITGVWMCPAGIVQPEHVAQQRVAIRALVRQVVAARHLDARSRSPGARSAASAAGTGTSWR